MTRSSMSGTPGIGITHANFSEGPTYWIWITAVTVSSGLSMKMICSFTSQAPLRLMSGAKASKAEILEMITVWAALEGRKGISGIAEKAAREPD